MERSILSWKEPFEVGKICCSWKDINVIGKIRLSVEFGWSKRISSTKFFVGLGISVRIKVRLFVDEIRLDQPNSTPRRIFPTSSISFQLQMVFPTSFQAFQLQTILSNLESTFPTKRFSQLHVSLREM